MRWMILIPGFLGVAAVLQGGLNRQIAARVGLPNTVLLSATMLLLASLALWVVAYRMPAALPWYLQLKGHRGLFAAWWVVPGLLGLALVLGIPFAIERVGAFPVFLGVLAGQLLTSLVWDALLEGRPLTPMKVCGALLALAGAALVGRGE
jgi:transporter family-2 protein